MKLKNVKVNNAFGCLLYVLTRIGMEEIYPISYDDITDGTQFEFLMYDGEILEKGDILVQSKEKKSMLVANEIIGIEIISNDVDKYIHYSVYEGRNLCTDMARSYNSNTPHIRKFRLDSRGFDYILRKYEKQ